MMQGVTRVDNEGRIVLDKDVLEEAKLEPGHLVEMKVAGSRGAHWIALYNRVRYAPGYFPEGKEVAVKKQVMPIKEAEKQRRAMEINY